VASAYAGVSANEVTDELLVDHLTGNVALNGVPVEVLPLTQDAAPSSVR
jgi:hypothetical protein